MIFEIDVCPLCRKQLYKYAKNNSTYYDCIPDSDIILNGTITHYSVIIPNNKIIHPIQRINIYPWGIDTVNQKSRIYKYVDPYKTWEFVKELPAIKPDIKENLLNRINKLIIFL